MQTDKGRIMYPQKPKYFIVIILFCLISLLLTLSCSSVITPPVQSVSTQELAFELPGTDSSTILVDYQGKVLKKALISSSDESVILSIEPGTTLVDENKTPLQNVSVVIDSIVPVPSEDTDLVGPIFDIQPPGANINPSLKLTLSYDPSELPQGVIEDDLWIYKYTDSGWDVVRYKNTDTELNRVTTTITDFGKYSVLARTKRLVVSTPATQAGSSFITLDQALSNGKPTLAEFGSVTCIPCKQMKPVLEQLTLDYKDKLNVVLIEIYEQRMLASRFNIMAIPTQVVFDSAGNEVTRHMGLWPRDQIDIELNKMGIK
jgi:thioredoxin 1